MNQELKSLEVEKMSKILESVNKRDFDRRISEVLEMLEEKQLYGTISLIKDLKYYLDLATKEKAHTCNCQHNSNSKDKQTNSDRIRNMPDEELAEFLCKVKSDYQWMEHEFPSEEEHGEWKEWLQSEAE